MPCKYYKNLKTSRSYLQRFRNYQQNFEEYKIELKMHLGRFGMTMLWSCDTAIRPFLMFPRVAPEEDKTTGKLGGIYLMNYKILHGMFFVKLRIYKGQKSSHRLIIRAVVNITLIYED
ncbi:unnamed protein product [Allacma fusca]|uniref:Uncharacterized protein n=1 Tax=Allacma fusca TaxID=39272 RepID=A0A8J2NWK0_9HEXA|nr:unnamed protein product [Allacma fusca]